ncbi:unnamed protein product [Allacma fusca]|uniref:lysozyme n=1 Tax=Allacma fusca TaxID=39272 RepID=A0A8J2PU23_9HEXA|nr:unnamed protein product [Allacma fusca]
MRFVFAIIVVVGIVSTVTAQLSDRCLGCICQASTKCKKDIGCTAAGVCGPLLISWPFWADAGKYVIKGTSPSSSNAYSDCATDLYCAAETVKAYMEKYEKDCNGDGVINCEDYARIHKLGPSNCGDASFFTTEYGTLFKQCSAAVSP